jgi:hypothetical protein
MSASSDTHVTHTETETLRESTAKASTRRKQGQRAMQAGCKRKDCKHENETQKGRVYRPHIQATLPVFNTEHGKSRHD